MKMHTINHLLPNRLRIRQILILSCIFTLCASFIQPAFAISDPSFLKQNGIRYFDPNSSGVCAQGSGSLEGDAPSSLTGKDKPEKVWNYFISRGLTPVAAAAAMGNMVQESSTFDPWAGEGGNKTISKTKLGVGFGIIQWTNTGGNTQGRRYGVMNHLETNGVSLDATKASSEDEALLLELNWLWDGEYGKRTWQEQVNAETNVAPSSSSATSVGYANQKAGDGAALIFHKLVERSGDNATGLQERITSAEEYLKLYGNGGAASGCSTNTNGLTDAQAQNLLAAYLSIDKGNEEEAQWGASEISCETKTDNCVRAAAWFVEKYTTLKFASGNGKEVVDNLLAKNSGLKSGKEPKPFSIFSSTYSSDAGHTGIILSVDEDAKKLTVFEAAYCDPDFTAVRTFTFDEWNNRVAKNPAYNQTKESITYAYLQDHLKEGVSF